MTPQHTYEDCCCLLQIGSSGRCTARIAAVPCSESIRDEPVLSNAFNRAHRRTSAGAPCMGCWQQVA